MSIEPTTHTLRSDRLTVTIGTIGAAVLSVEQPDRDGNVRNVCLRLPEMDDYLDNPSNFGAVVGPYANRIGQARFVLDGITYELDANNGPNSLHSGSANLARHRWSVDDSSATSVTLRTQHGDGEGGLPGPIDFVARYELDGETLAMQLSAIAGPKPVVASLTNHAYWNLGGVTDDGSVESDVLDHRLQLSAFRYLVPDENVLPTGRIDPVDATPFDFRQPQPLGRADRDPTGFDHCFVVDGEAGRLRTAGTIVDPASGRRLTVATTLPGVQLYTANHFGGEDSNAGYEAFEGFCLECQHFPDSPNRPTFPSTRVGPGQSVSSVTTYTFTVD